MQKHENKWKAMSEIKEQVMASLALPGIHKYLIGTQNISGLL